MDAMSTVAAGILGVVAGGAVGAWLWGRERARAARLARTLHDLEEASRARDGELERTRTALAALQIEHVKQTERARYEEQVHGARLEALRDAQNAAGEVFKGLSQEALQHNNQLFLSLAQERLGALTQGASADLKAREQAIAHLVGPVVERLNRVDALLAQLEIKRESAYQSLTDQVKALIEGHLPRLHRETANLVKALREPAARGRWGELQLKRVVEMAGMLDHCDFIEQVHTTGDEGRVLRPDLVVKLPGGRHVVVDAKTPVDAYLSAVEAEDEAVRAASLKRHAAQLRTHLNQLAKKSYWEQFPRAPEFVVMFVPGEVFFSAALREDPALIETGVDQKVIPASPTTLIALLRAVSYGWQQDAIARNAEEIAALGRELYKRVALLGRGWSDTGAKLAAAVQAYNKTVGTLEARVLPQARRFWDLRAADEDEIPVLDALPEEPRPLSAPELAGPSAPDE
ncbi:DNA recombination protein RmuC [Acidiferrobacter sp.]|uniref:DNA recombination protein RmuC n=1 Tax=Acidiferrobacter sp. TaxID=1872107 RepID=UPI00261A748D|nr:DNA recombination protein RmuC [Acidiferrobacter sp.]